MFDNKKLTKYFLTTFFSCFLMIINTELKNIKNRLKTFKFSNGLLFYKILEKQFSTTIFKNRFLELF